jgi:hypothetical protein
MVAVRCPRCHRVNDASAWRCGCGHEIGRGVVGALAALHDRQVAGWAALALLLAADLVVVIGVVGAALEGFIATAALSFTAMILLTGRAVKRVRSMRARLRRLTALLPELPRAVVHRR